MLDDDSSCVPSIHIKPMTGSIVITSDSANGSTVVIFNDDVVVPSLSTGDAVLSKGAKSDTIA